MLPPDEVQRAAFVPLFKGGKRIHLAVQVGGWAGGGWFLFCFDFFDFFFLGGGVQEVRLGWIAGALVLDVPCQPGGRPAGSLRHPACGTGPELPTSKAGLSLASASLLAPPPSPRSL